MDENTHQQIRELMFFGHEAVKAARAGKLVCAANGAGTSEAFRAGAIIAADVLTAHLSYGTAWQQVVVTIIANEEMEH
jgi:hypothetical protein